MLESLGMARSESGLHALMTVEPLHMHSSASSEQPKLSQLHEFGTCSPIEPRPSLYLHLHGLDDFCCSQRCMNPPFFRDAAPDPEQRPFAALAVQGWQRCPSPDSRLCL